MTYADPEDQVAAEIAAMEAKGLDPYADTATPQAEPEAPAEPEQRAEPTATQEAPAAQAVAPQDEAAQAVTSTAPQSFSVQMPAGMASKRAELIQAKGAAMKQLMDGEIDADAYAAAEADITAQLEDLAAARFRAETLEEMNRQQAAGYQGKVINDLVARTKGEIDYLASRDLQERFDTALKLVANESEFADKDFADIAEEAHRIVLARMGRTPVATPAAKTAPNRTPPVPPVTLSGLPTAATSGAQPVNQVIGRLVGDDLERALDSMNPAELQKLMRG